MSIRFYIVLCTVLVCCCCSNLKAQNNQFGKEFWFVPFGNTEGHADSYIYLYITAPKPTKGTVYIRKKNGDTSSVKFTISVINQPLEIIFDNDTLTTFGASPTLEFPGQNRSVCKQHIHIIADDEVSISTVNEHYASSDASIIFPVHTLGNTYTVAAIYTGSRKTTFDTKYGLSQTTITAMYDDTHIAVQSPVNLILHTAKDTTIVLNRGESYLFQAKPSTQNPTADLTGMRIMANKPISVISGATAYIYPNDGDRSGSTVFEHQLPEEHYGNFYVIGTHQNAKDDNTGTANILQIVCMDSIADVLVNGEDSRRLKRGQYLRYQQYIPFTIHSTGKIACHTFHHSSLSTIAVGDPFMTQHAPVETWANKYSFIIPPNIHPRLFLLHFVEGYATITLPTATVTSLRVNGKGFVAKDFTKVTTPRPSGLGTDFSTINVPLKPGMATIEADMPIGVIYYGYGVSKAYGTIPGRYIEDPMPPLIALHDTVICFGSTAQLSVSGGMGNYQWTPASGLSCTDCNTPIANPTETTTYYVQSKNRVGMPIIDSVTVKVQYAQVDAGKDVGICSGDSIRLRASEGKNYLWSPSEGLSCTDCREPFAKPTKNQRYYVTITDLKGCFGTDSVLVTVGKPTADAGKDTTICLGTSVRVRASGGNTYRWSASPDLSCTDCPDPIITPKQSTTYTVTSYLSGNCFATDSIRITIDKPTITITTDKTILCPTDSVILKAEGGIQTQWIGEGIVCDNCSETKASPTKSGYYRATITTAAGCTISDSVFITLNTPTAKVSPDTIICKGNTALLRAEGGIRYSWSPPTGLSCTDCARPTAIPQQTTTYTVTSYDNNNCTAQASVLITVDSCLIVIKADTITLTASMNCAQIEDEQKYIHNSNKPLQLQVPELISGDGSAFVVTYNIPTNSTLNNNEELIVTTELLSTSSTPKQALYRLGRSEERELHLKASGEYITKTANLRPLDTLGVIPGESFVPIRLQADGDIERIRELRTILSFPSRFMNYVTNKHRIISSAGWNFGIEKSEEKNGITYVTLRGTGTTALSDKKEIVMIETDIYLGDSVEFTVMTEQSEVPNECYTIPQGKGIVSLGGCFAGGRAIGTGIPYSVQAKTENNTLVIDYTAGLDGITECEIYNALGTYIESPLHRFDQKGEHTYQYILPHLANGVYILNFRSGVFTTTLLVTIIR